MGTLPHDDQDGVCHGHGLGSLRRVSVTYGAGGGAQTGRAQPGPPSAPTYVYRDEPDDFDLERALASFREHLRDDGPLPGAFTIATAAHAPARAPARGSKR